MSLVRTTTPGPFGSVPAPEPRPSDPFASLTHPDAAVRRDAVFALDELDSAAAVPALLARLFAEPDVVVRTAILTVLGGHDEIGVARQLSVHLSSEDAALRTGVVEALSAMPHGVVPLLPTLVVDPDPDVRILTAMVLARLDAAEAESWLLEMIRSDDHPNVVAAAIDAVTPSPGREYITLLQGVRLRFGTDPFLQFVVATALAELDR